MLSFLSEIGIVKYDGPILRDSHVVTDTDMISVRTSKSGIFEGLVSPGDKVQIGQPLANIINPYDGELKETLYAPIKATVFFIHSHPFIYANTSVIKLVE